MSRIGRFIGMAAADLVNLFRGRQAVPCLVNLFRGRQAVPCLVDWEQTEWEPPADPADDEYGTYRRARERVAISAAQRNEDDCCNSCTHGCWH